MHLHISYSFLKLLSFPLYYCRIEFKWNIIDAYSRTTLPLNVHDLDANPTRRLLPIRSEPEDENTLFIQSYGQDFYSSLMSRDYYIDADKARQNGLRVEERYMVVSLLAGIVIQRNLTDSTLHLAVQLMTRYFALDDSIPDEWTREKYIIVASM